MPRAVLDTNALISALMYEGRPAEAVKLCRRSGFVQLISQPLLDELRRTLVRRFLLSEPVVEAAMEDILRHSLLIASELRLEACRDPDDNRVLECAVAGQAGLIVTGDKDLLVLNPFQGIEIVTVRQFLDSHGPDSE